MMNRMIFRGFLFAAVSVYAISCTAGYLEINRNPYGVTDDETQRDGYAVKAALLGIANGVVSPDANTAQFTECCLGGTMGGYMADAKPAWANTISNYNPTDNWTNVFMRSDRVIPLIYANYRSLHQVTDDPVLHAVGDILKVAAMHRVTDTYGPIPYSRIGQNGEINVPYDSQEEVYRKMFSELDGAVETLMPYRTSGFSAKADPIYGGDIVRWIRFANSLKLRLAMRVSYADPELSREMAESAVANEVGVIESNEDNAEFAIWGTAGNPLKVAVEYNNDDIPTGHSCQTRSGDSHAAADIICYMNGYDDPRRAAYFTKTEFTSSDGVTSEYLGMRRCIKIPSHKDVGHKFSGINISSDTPSYWLSASEVAFLKAEAAGVFNYDMGTDAKTAYEQGVRLSFEQYGVGGADEYLKSTSQPDAYFAPGFEGGSTGSTITVAWNDDADPEEMQERIITQKWIANWLLGNEAWADWRRTGYPRLLPGTDAGNYSGGKVDNRQGARRMPYPADEVGTNGTNYHDAVDNLLNGRDEMSTRLWFDCKDNNPSYR